MPIRYELYLVVITIAHEFNFFFEGLVDQLQQAGKIPKTDPTEAKELLASPLQCNKCNYKPKNMPNLKDHLRTHRC